MGLVVFFRTNLTNVRLATDGQTKQTDIISA